MITKLLAEKILYSGFELQPHWISERLGQYGDALVAFRGPCLVATGELVDLEDRRAGERIEAKEMLHFLGEFYTIDLRLTIAYQRLLAAIIAEEFQDQVKSPEIRCLRRGDDVMIAHKNQELRKLSVSIATASAVSTLLHFGVNVDPTGAPVPAIGLLELGIEPTAFASRVLQLWTEEISSLAIARAKVLPRL